jgi:hypothetical protein
MNRKLIRPDLHELNQQPHMPSSPKYRTRKPASPESTNAEANYFQKQMDHKTRMVIVLKDGEVIHGTIEWYDRNSIKVHRPSDPNLFLMKDCVKYIYKENEEKGED